MATQPDEGEPLELTEELEIDPLVEEADPVEPGEEPDEEADETIIAFGDDEAEQPDDNSTIRHLREKLKEKDARVRELERAVPPKKTEVGPKPTLWDEGIEGDEDEYDKRLLAWQRRKDDEDAESARANEASKAVSESWAAAKREYDEQAAKHGFDDIKDDEALVDEALGQLSPVILKAARDKALMIRALGRNPAKLAELAKIKDPFELAATIARMEGGIKVVTKRKAPSPDRAESGSASLSGVGSSDEQLEKLEKEAVRTGVRTKVIEYKRRLKQREKAK